MISSPEPVLAVNELGVIFSDASGVVHALGGLTFSLPPNAFVTLIGPSGSGKSTLLRVLAGLVPPTRGEFHFNKIQPKVGLVFQKANLMPWRRVLDNICLPLELQGIPKDAVRRRAQELIHLVGLEGFEQDALTREKMGDELLHIWQARRKTVLMVTHSISEAIYLSDRVLVLSPRPGRIVLDLPVDLPRPRTGEMRYMTEFGQLAHTLRDQLREVSEISG